MKGTDEAAKFRDMVYKMSPDIVYSFVFSSSCLAAADASAVPHRLGWWGFSQMGKRLLTKGTASAVP
jgi:hypothetical protein